MPKIPSSVLQEIVNVIKRFKFEDLELSIMPTFPEISWNSVRSRLIKTHRHFTATNVAQIIKIAITEANLGEKVLSDRLSTLQLIDVSWHSYKRTWYGYTLIGFNKSANHLISKEVQNKMQYYFDSLNMKVSVKVHAHNGITYISITEKKNKRKRGRVQHTVPLFFALFMGQKYVFCNRKYISTNILNAIVETLGYKGIKRFKLVGKNLESLNELCWKKKEGALDSENINKILVFKEAAPDVKETGIDFSQQKQLKKYAEECFGDNPPTLELLVINGPSTPLSHREASTKLLNENMRVTWEFRSRNIASCLTKLIERRILVTPVPYYISNLMVLGKNEFTLK